MIIGNKLQIMLAEVSTKPINTKNELMINCILENFSDTSIQEILELIDVVKDMQKPYFVLTTIILYGKSYGCNCLRFFKEKYEEPINEDDLIKAINLFDWLQGEFIFVKIEKNTIEIYT